MAPEQVASVVEEAVAQQPTPVRVEAAPVAENPVVHAVRHLGHYANRFTHLMYEPTDH